MSSSRRKFLKLSALAGGSVGLGLLPGASELLAGSVGTAVKPLRILILGGTGFTGDIGFTRRRTTGLESDRVAAIVARAADVAGIDQHGRVQHQR